MTDVIFTWYWQTFGMTLFVATIIVILWNIIEVSNEIEYVEIDEDEMEGIAI
ncbi:hypothetical protein [Aneurinibacillus aneurinilyticus]|uniref:hypothetical protein n=1 Tax=Aneurinibacillus aneurinilyticus TaxID=1391 RepID=UPI0023EF5C27|nr:hypothetical protein [Aneurinibacillus aneurinilyticus]